MLIKILDAPDYLIEILKPETGERTASKAVLVAAQRYPGLVDQVHRQRAEIAELREQLWRMKSTVDSLHSICRQISEISGQSDIFVANPDLPEGH